MNAALKKICQIPGALILLVLTSATLVIVERVTTAQESTSVPNFEMDPLFFQNLPNRWTTDRWAASASTIRITSGFFIVPPPLPKESDRRH